MADHLFGPATDRGLGKLLPHQLANQTQAPPSPWADSIPPFASQQPPDKVFPIFGGILIWYFGLGYQPINVEFLLFPQGSSYDSLFGFLFLLLLLSLRGISSRFQLLFPSQGQVLTRYSPVRHWKHHSPSDLHVLGIPPAFILS